MNHNGLVASEMFIHRFQKTAKVLDGIRYRPVRNRKGNKINSAQAARVGLLRKLKLGRLIRFQGRDDAPDPFGFEQTEIFFQPVAAPWPWHDSQPAAFRSQP